MYSWNKSVILGYLLRLEIKILDLYIVNDLTGIIRNEKNKDFAK